RSPSVRKPDLSLRRHASRSFPFSSDFPNLTKVVVCHGTEPLSGLASPERPPAWKNPGLAALALWPVPPRSLRSRARHLLPEVPVLQLQPRLDARVSRQAHEQEVTRPEGMPMRRVEVAVVKDATAAPRHPEIGDGYQAALVNYGFLANAVLST